MTYLTLEQCQRLKEIGFPQEERFTHYMRNSLTGDVYCSYQFVVASEYGESYPYEDEEGNSVELSCPTLEELIDWLGRDFDDVRRHGIGFYSAHSLETHPEHLYGEGATPLEAVYNLCIAIKTN